MKTKTAIATMLALFLVFSTASALPNNFIKGDLLLQIDKREYNAGETMQLSLTVTNLDPTPIAGASIVLEFVQGDQRFEPSQASDSDNIFSEQKIPEISLRTGETKKIPFYFALPPDLADGNYRVDAYFKTDLTYIVGIPHIFLSPKSEKFTVKGTGDYPNLKIVRTKTAFNDTVGPVGAPTEPGSTIKGKVFIQNTGKQKSENAKLIVSICEWDDIACKTFDQIKETKIETIEAGTEKEINVELTAPSIPSAYAIKIEIIEENRIVSFYRNRSIVSGGTAKVRKLSINNYEFSQNDTGKITLLVGPTPDHYSLPAFTDFDAKVWIENIEEKGIVFEDKVRIPSISIQEMKTQDYPSFEFPFTAKQALSHFNLCASIEKTGTVFDKKCIEFDARKFSLPQEEILVKTYWKYDGEKKQLEIEFCSEPNEKNMKAVFFLVEKGQTEPIGEGTLSAKCETKNFTVPIAALELVITNHSTKRQTRETIELAQLSAAGIENKNCSEANGTVCAANEQCVVNEKQALDTEKCCLSKCEKTISSATKAPEQWLLIAIILIALLILIGWRVKKNA